MTLFSSAVAHAFGHRSVALQAYLPSRPCIIPTTRQVHGTKVHVLKTPIPTELEGDAFITDQPGIVCCVRTADCVPLLFFDPVNNVVGAIHAGWRGTAAGIVPEVVKTCRETFGTRPKDIRMSIGPAIGVECYRVGEEVVHALGGERSGGCVHDEHGWRVDLSAINRHQSLAAGVLADNIEMAGLCTACHPELFASYRRDGSQDRQNSFIVLL